MLAEGIVIVMTRIVVLEVIVVAAIKVMRAIPISAQDATVGFFLR